MLTDIEIAKQAKMKKITEIADGIGISADDLEPYGHYKAKLSEELYTKLADKPDGKLILVTAINPTPAGEGKTTISVGLAESMAKIGKKAILALREPLARPRIRHKGRRCWRRIRSGSAYGGYKPAFYGRYARHHRGEQPALRADRQLYAAGQPAENRPEKDTL